MNLPNTLSLLRLAAVPVFVFVYFSDSPNAHIWAGVVFILASLTDILDGYIARTYNKITKLGRILDPAADKCMTAAVLICMTVSHIIPIWVPVLFILKELLMLTGGILMYRNAGDVFSSALAGKISTFLFFLTSIVLLFTSLPDIVVKIMFAAALISAFIALTVYTKRFFSFLKKSKSLQ